MRRALHHRRAVAAVAVLALAACGCFNPFDPLRAGRGLSSAPPVPSSASGILRLLEWCYLNRAASEYRELFTDDYRFLFSALDSTGAAYRDNPWTREDELISTTNLFQGGDASQPAASNIQLILDKNFRITNDPNFPNSGKWYKSIRSTVTLIITTTDGAQTNVNGNARFFLVRGDSALIPEELRLRGFGPDSLRWYIRRWEDETAVGHAALLAGRVAEQATAATPGQARGGSVAAEAATGEFLDLTWGQVKHIYRRTFPLP